MGPSVFPCQFSAWKLVSDAGCWQEFTTIHSADSVQVFFVPLCATPTGLRCREHGLMDSAESLLLASPRGDQGFLRRAGIVAMYAPFNWLG